MPPSAPGAYSSLPKAGSVSSFAPNDGNGRNAKSGRVVRKLCQIRLPADRWPAASPIHRRCLIRLTNQHLLTLVAFARLKP